MILKALAVCLVLAGAGPALAAQATQAAPGDPRIRFVDYDPNNIVTIYGRVGTDTLILFEKGEVLVDMTGGDTAAWGADTPKARNGIFVKPKATVANTNIHVITNKRVYNFDMKLAPKGQKGYLMVSFRYPSAEAIRMAEAANKNKARNLLMGAASVAGNRRYTVQGSSAIAPIEAADDGTSTSFRFAAHGSVPAIYTVEEDGKEHLVNFNSEPNDTLTIHVVRNKFVFRSGELVACVYNEAYAPAGVRAPTNTASPDVERVLKRGNSQ